MAIAFDPLLPWRGRPTSNPDNLKRTYGVDDPDAIAMWVADMHFTGAPVLLDPLR